MVHPKMIIIYSPPGHPRCRWVCFFIRTDLKKFSFTSLAHQWILSVNGCHQNERQTADKNITVIHKTTVHQLMSCELTSCMFVRNSVLLVNNCDVLISWLDSHSDGTHSLQMIHWWANDIMLHFSKSDEETNSSTSWMAWGWVHFQF